MTNENIDPDNEYNHDEAIPPIISEIETLKEQLLEAEKKKDEYLTLVKSTRADFENYQKRSQTIGVHKSNKEYGGVIWKMNSKGKR